MAVLEPYEATCLLELLETMKIYMEILPLVYAI